MDSGRDIREEGEMNESVVVELTPGQRICWDRGYHDEQPLIDPKSGLFKRCKDCGRDVDLEESEEW